MMISPEMYYEENLKGQTAEEIMRCIRSLKYDISSLKRMIDQPSCDCMDPGPDVRLFCTRLYLNRAIEALKEAGGDYKPSKLELKVEAFNAAVPLISKIVFTVGGWNVGFETRIVTFDDEKLNIDISYKGNHRVVNKDAAAEYCEDVSKEEFLEGFKDLYIGEWRQKYGCKKTGIDFDADFSWCLEIHYSDGRKVVRYSGIDDYPYTFDKLKELFGMYY